jgi:hypothetical protein
MIRTSPLGRPGELRAVLTNQAGVIDLGSIMTGVIVLGILTSAAAAAVMGIVPYSQDEFAKNSLKSVRSAEVSASMRDGKYKDYRQLVDQGHLGENNAFTIGLGDSGSCYVASARSDSGATFYVTSAGSGILNNKAGPVDTSWCTTLPVAAGA